MRLNDPKDTTIAVIHYQGVFAPWSTSENRPLATGTGPNPVRSLLMARGFTESEANLALETAVHHGSTEPSRLEGQFMSASELMEDNAAGAFGEDVPVEEIFRYLLIDKRPL